MSTDYDRLEEYLKELADRFTAEELVEALGLDVRDIIDQFYELIIDSPNLIELKEERL